MPDDRLYQLGNVAEAERNYQVALGLNPGLMEVYREYSDFLLSHGRAQEATEVLTQVGRHVCTSAVIKM